MSDIVPVISKAAIQILHAASSLPPDLRLALALLPGFALAGFAIYAVLVVSRRG